MMRGVAQRTDKCALSVSGEGMVYPVTPVILHGLPCPSFSLITVRSHTHTLSNSQCSDSKQHPSYGHYASLWEGGKCLFKANIGSVLSQHTKWIWRVNLKETWETNVGKKHKPVSWVTGGSEIPSFVRLCVRECVKHESCWRSLYTQHRASHPPVYIRSIKLFSQRFAQGKASCCWIFMSADSWHLVRSRFLSNSECLVPVAVKRRIAPMLRSFFRKLFHQI